LCRVAFKTGLLGAIKTGRVKTLGYEQHDGSSFGIRGLAEVAGFPVGAEAAQDVGAWRGGDGEALVADGDAGVLAPDVGPPQAGWRGVDDGALLGQRLLVAAWGVWPSSR
jgi:hypothetical protein